MQDSIWLAEIWFKANSNNKMKNIMKVMKSLKTRGIFLRNYYENY